MLTGLLKSLPETKNSITEAITCQDVEQLKTLIHKLNGACCYTGVPSLGKISMQLETELKQGMSVDDLEPEFFEFFEHVERVLVEAPKTLASINLH
jgi:two-component system sensor histidine kinase BarA